MAVHGFALSRWRPTVHGGGAKPRLPCSAAPGQAAGRAVRRRNGGGASSGGMSWLAAGNVPHVLPAAAADAALGTAAAATAAARRRRPSAPAGAALPPVLPPSPAQPALPARHSSAACRSQGGPRQQPLMPAGSHRRNLPHPQRAVPCPEPARKARRCGSDRVAARAPRASLVDFSAPGSSCGSDRVAARAPRGRRAPLGAHQEVQPERDGHRRIADGLQLVLREGQGHPGAEPLGKARQAPKVGGVDVPAVLDLDREGPVL